MAALGTSIGVGAGKDPRLCAKGTTSRFGAFSKLGCATSSRKIGSCIRLFGSTTTNLPGIVEDSNCIQQPGDGDFGGGHDDGGNGGGKWNNGGGGGGSNGWTGGSPDGDSASHFIFGFWEALIKGWKARVRTDPQFPFKVLTEEIIGVGACVLGDMASRPNFGLNELDFVFSTVVVGSILNFALMYMLAPTSASADITRLPGIFASCPPGHMFEPGAYTVFDRMGTFVYKGVLFAAAGFAAGLVGTAISTLLLNARKKMDPNFTIPNKPPPTLLNAGTWALHMGLSSNLRYQGINGIEHILAASLPPTIFKGFVFAIRAANNVLGGTSFVLLARLTGSQRSQQKQEVAHVDVDTV